MGANRLGIWEETVKLILKRPLIGHGADTLYYYFPNKSLAAYEKITNVYNGDIITKPHNYYLSIAFDAGIPALLSFISLVGIIYRRTLILLISGKLHDNGNMTGAPAVFCSGLLCQAIPNDITISTAVLLWISLGLWVGQIYRISCKGACL
jgi:O-antigen ligase